MKMSGRENGDSGQADQSKDQRERLELVQVEFHLSLSEKGRAPVVGSKVKSVSGAP